MAGILKKLAEGIAGPFGLTGYNRYLLRMLKRPEWIYRARGKIPFLKLTFVPPAPVTSADLALAERLIAAYRKAVEDFPSDAGLSPIWSRNIQQHSQPLLRALRQPNPAPLASILASMFRAEFLHGIASGHLHADARSWLGSRIWSWKCFDDLVALAESLGAVRAECPEQGALGYAFNEGPSALVTRIETSIGIPIGFPPVGAPYGLSIGGALITMESPEHIYAGYRVCEAARIHLGAFAAQPLHIVEIGGGFGGTAYWLLRLKRLSVTRYTLADLPLACVLQGYFLSKALGESQVALYGEASEKTSSVLVLPAGALVSLEESADVLLNQNSLPEIPAAIGIQYLQWAKDHVRGIFFSYNQEAFSPAGGVPQVLVSEIAEKAGGFRRLSRAASWLRRGYVEEVYACTAGKA